MKATYSTAIARFQEIGEVIVSHKTVYATYISGVYHHFFEAESEAIDYCNDPTNGTEFNNTWFQSDYTTYAPGELFIVKGNHSVYYCRDTDRHPDAIADISFVEWAFMPAKD